MGLRPGGRLVIADVVASEDAGEAELQNAIENLRDPSHVRMLPLTELSSLVTSAGFEIVARTTWDKDREFDEWMGIANDAQRAQSLRIVARRLAADGHTAGMGLSLVDDRLVFFHRWTFLLPTPFWRLPPMTRSPYGWARPISARAPTPGFP